MAEPSGPIDTDLQVQSAEADFNRSAGLKLLWYAFLGVGGLVLTMVALSYGSRLLGATTEGSQGIDATNKAITLILRDEPPQLDSSLATDQISGMIIGHVMESLLRYDENNRLVAGMAERWDIREDGATFWIRENARWSDGEPVTAADFVFAWQTALDPASASEYAFILFPIKNGEAINTGELPREELGAIAATERRLEITFENPIAYFDKLVAFATYSPIRQDFYESTNGRYGADADMLLYNGPFRISRWVHGAHLRLERNPYYWNPERIHLDVIDFPYFTQDTNASLNLFKAGSVAATTLHAENLNDALNRRWHLNRYQDGSVFYIEFNHREGHPTRNRNLRKAMQLAFDPNELVYKVIKLPGYLPGESLFPVWLRGVEGFFRAEYAAPQWMVDIERAKEHLAKAKQELGVDKIPPLMLLSGDNPISNKQSEYFQALYKRTLGLEIRIDKQIFKQRLAKMTSGEFDMVLAGWGPDFSDPLTFGDLFSSWNLNNRGRYSNPDLDRQVRIAQKSLDTQVRMDAFGEIQKILFDEVVILPNYERGIVYVTDPRLKGSVRRAVGPDPDYTNAYIELPNEKG